MTQKYQKMADFIADEIKKALDPWRVGKEEKKKIKMYTGKP